MMKKQFYCFSTAILMLCCFSAQAQHKDDLFIGIKGGLSVPSLKAGETENDWNKDYESRLGPYFAVFAEYKLGRYFYFQPELAYAAEGGRRNGIQPMSIPEKYLAGFQQAFQTQKDYLYANLHNVSRLNYLQLPLIIKFAYPIAFHGHLNVFAQAGPYLGYLLVSKQVVKSEKLRVYLDGEGKVEIPSPLVREFFGASLDTVIQAKDDLHRWNVGIQGGVGLSWVSGKNKIFLEGGGNYGFIPVQSGKEHGKDNIGAATILIGYMRNIRWGNSETDKK